ncbi:MAG: NAD(+) diphosphatase [Brevirhabdus sp.]
MPLLQTVTFAGGALERAAHLRAASDALLTRDDARVIALWQGRPLVRDDRSGLAMLMRGHAVLDGRAPVVFLGLEGGAPRFAIDLSGWQPDTEQQAQVPSFFDQSEVRHPGIADAHFAELRAVMTMLDPMEAELAATAKAVLGWHRSHRFCSACGTQSDMAEGGWQRLCPGCGTRHFPRTDPVVIMLVTDGNKVLVGRSPGWPEGMYSLLAGFAEPGETIEAATRREVFEETGVIVGDVKYLACQPWPFPSSLMIATAAEARTTRLTLDPVEIEDAMWLTREEMLDVEAGQHRDILPPRKGAIAGFIIRNWLADRLD